MQNKYFKIFLIALAVAIIVPQIAFASWWNPMTWGWLNSIFHFQKTEQQNPVACTMEAKLCPDGSSVGRQGPKCEFATCPEVKDQPVDWKTYTNTQYGFSFDYPVNDVNLLKDPLVLNGFCDTSEQQNTCIMFTSDKEYDFSGMKTYGGLAIEVFDRALDNESIHKYDGVSLVGQKTDVAEKTTIGGKNAYKFDIVSAVNYKIKSFMVPIDNSHFLEVYENSKYPLVGASDWDRIMSTFKFTNSQPIVGGNKDAHGCIGSAGYTWCEVKQKCLRTWEEACNILSDTYPLFSNATWSSPITTKLNIYNESNVAVQEIKGVGQINDNKQSQDFLNYYKNKLTMTGWVEDINEASDGILAGERGYRKDNDLIVLLYQLTPGKVISGANEPMQWTCPCNMDYKIFTGKTNCEVLYWFDNTSDNPCQTKNFCGAYMYNGLHTFKNQNECFNGWSQASGRGQISQELKECLIMGEKVSHLNNCTSGQCWDELNKRCTNITIIK